MKTQRGDLFKKDLLELIHDFNYTPVEPKSINSNLSSLLPAINALMIHSLDQWFVTEGQEFSQEYRRKTDLRFCLTVGVGAAWFYYFQRPKVKTADDLFNLMASPRGEDAMDEYIEDAVGLWFSSESDKHSQWLALCDCCYDMALRHFDLSLPEHRDHACLVAMNAGAIIGIYMIEKIKVKAKYMGEFAWNEDMWKHLFPASDQHSKQTPLDHWTAMCLESGIPIDGNIISSHKNDASEPQVDCYHKVIFNDNANVQTIFHIDDNSPQAVVTIPRLETSNSHFLIIDKVYERANGLEASIKAHFADDPDTQITFYDTEYLKNHNQYFPENLYAFDLYGMGYNVNAVPESRKQSANEKPLYSFIQLDESHPEICHFRAPIKEVFLDFEIKSPTFFEVGIEIPYQEIFAGKKHRLSLFIPMHQMKEKIKDFHKGSPIEGTIILMGKMRMEMSMDERPSEEVHSFTPLTQRGTPRCFTHRCKPSEAGTEMSAAERQEFAKKMMSQFLGQRLEEPHNDELPDIITSRRGAIWVKSDEDYRAAERFKTEDIFHALSYSYQMGRFPIMVYVSLYDTMGNPCQWLKGGTYTVQLHYGSMYPGQRMEPRDSYEPEVLSQILLEAYQNSHTFPLCKVLHKNLYVTSHHLIDPIITRDEFLLYLNREFQANRQSDKGNIQADLLIDKQTSLPYLLLTTPEGNVDRLDFTIQHNLITEIHISNVKRKKTV